MSSSEPSDHARRNRAWWDEQADAYQREHGEHIGRPEPRGGMWQLPESELQILGDVSGKDVLELGCRAAQWSILLAGLGARPVGLDLDVPERGGDGVGAAVADGARLEGAEGMTPLGHLAW